MGKETSDDGSKFAINSSGDVTFFKNSPNFEIPVDSDKDNKYKFKVIATDTLENKTNRVSSLMLPILRMDQK